MKKALVFIILTFLLGCATMKEVPIEERQVQAVYEMPGLNQKQIYEKANEWVVKNIISSSENIYLKDPENGKIIGKGETELKVTMGVVIPCQYTITIETKDGKVRIICDQFYALALNPKTNRYENKQLIVQEDFVNQVKTNLTKMINNMYIYLKEQKSNW